MTVGAASHRRMPLFGTTTFWLERLPQLLDLTIRLGVSVVTAVFFPAVTAEPDYGI
jgi:hypothetical protein